MKKIIVLALITLLLFGCMKRMTKEEWVQNTTRVYPGVTAEQALASVERVLTLMDGDDVEFYPNDDNTGFQAIRRWGCYIVIAFSAGVDYWDVKARDTPAGAHVRVTVTRAASAVAPMPTAASSSHGGGNWFAAGSATPGLPIIGNATYHVFWSRMDYVLGRSTDWIVCDRAIDMLQAGEVWGMIEPVCDLCNVADNRPDELRGKVLYEKKVTSHK